MYNVEYHNHNFDNSSDDYLLLDTAKTIVNNIKSGDSYYQIFKRNDLQNISQNFIDIADKIRNSFSDLIVISMGGASLNPQMLVKFLGQDDASPKIHFLNNTDPLFFNDLLSNIDIKNSEVMIAREFGDLNESTN